MLSADGASSGLKQGEYNQFAQKQKGDTSLSHYLGLAEAGFVKCTIGNGFGVPKTPPNCKGLYDTIEVVLLAETEEDEDKTHFPEVLKRGQQEKEQEIKIGEHLKQHHKDELKKVSFEYPDIFSDHPEKTGLIQFKLTSYKQAPHGMPEALKPATHAEEVI